MSTNRSKKNRRNYDWNKLIKYIPLVLEIIDKIIELFKYWNK